MADNINLLISEELKQKLERKIKETGFDSVQEYISFILEQVTSEDVKDEREDIYTPNEENKFAAAIGNSLEKTGDDDPYTEQDEEKLKKHLEEKGYL